MYIHHLVAALALLPSLATGEKVMTEQPAPLVLEGSWEMTAAYEILADGTRVTTYSEHPHGLMMIDRDGRYAIQIFRPDRPKFASGDKTRGTSEEYRAAVLGSSTHFGRVRALPDGRTLIFDVEAASFPNWEGKQQRREYSFSDGVLSYAVPASASGNGTIAWSLWRRLR
jgi:hypothetical protein